MIWRFLLRFLLVPIAILVACVVDSTVICVANWHEFAREVAHDPKAPENFILAVIFIGPALVAIMAVGSLITLTVGVVGVTISEVFAIRSWMFHVGNGALSSWIGWVTSAQFRELWNFFNDPTAVIGAGIAAGFAYWAIAGWTAGFWKPVFAKAAPTTTATA